MPTLLPPNAPPPNHPNCDQPHLALVDQHLQAEVCSAQRHGHVVGVGCNHAGAGHAQRAGLNKHHAVAAAAAAGAGAAMAGAEHHFVTGVSDITSAGDFGYNRH